MLSAQLHSVLIRVGRVSRSPLDLLPILLVKLMELPELLEHLEQRLRDERCRGKIKQLEKISGKIKI